MPILLILYVVSQLIILSNLQVLKLFAIHPSSITRWRKRIGDAGAEELLKETTEAVLEVKAVRQQQFDRVNVDTTVREKENRFPSDARL